MSAQASRLEGQKGNSLEWNGVHYATMPCVDSPLLVQAGWNVSLRFQTMSSPGWAQAVSLIGPFVALFGST